MRVSSLADPLLALLMIVTGARAAPPPSRTDPPVVIIVTSQAVEPFEEATQGIKRALGSAARLVTVDSSSTPQELSARLGARDISLLITVGTNALEAAARYGSAPILATMVLRGDLVSSRMRPPLGAVALDLGLAEVLHAITRMFPGKSRVGMIRGAEAASVSPASLIAQAKAVGATLKVIDCPRPDGLIRSFLSLRAEVDFVWCPPDRTLYNGTTVKPLILASLENQLPVIGFSESFVHAGAAAGIYPDYAAVGAQTGELARKYLAGANAAITEVPAKLRIVANPRVVRLLGLRLAQKGAEQSGLVVLE